MAQRSATVTHLQYWRKYARGEDKEKDVASLPDGGDLLTFAHAVWRDLDRDAMMDQPRFRACRPERARLITEGRSLVCAANVGVFGEPATLRDVVTDVEVARHDGEQTHAVTVRVCLLVPARGTSALLFVEHAHEGSLGRQFLRVLEDAWRLKYEDWTLRTQALTRSDAWLEHARLEEVVAEGWGYGTDIAGSNSPRKLGKVRSVLRPDGGGGFPRWVLEKLRSQEISPRVLFGLEHEPEQVKVTLGSDGQQRTFVLGSDTKTPAVRELIADHGYPVPGDEAFRQWSLGRAEDYFRPVGVRWDAQWNRGSWTPEQLAVTV